MQDLDRRLTRLTLRRLDVALIVPYRLAFGAQTHFYCLIVEAEDQDGRVGWGEAALLPGYTDETVESAMDLAGRTAPGLIGLPLHAAMETLEALIGPAAFTATAFLTAIEHLAGHPTLGRAGRQRLLGTVNAKPSDPAALEAEIEGLLATGYDTLKVKVGFDVAADRAAVATIRAIVAGRARLRLDGNQGYSTAQALAFLDGLDPTGIELLEQPCAAGDWDAAVAVKRAAPCPVMLDESIYGEDDIRRAADLGAADYIKLKLMKMGGLDRLERGLALIRALGMRPVMGNGVATDLGCWMEAAVGSVALDNAGEMNGFLKPRLRLLTPALATDGPDIVLDGAPRAVDPAAFAGVAAQEFR
jgi:L-alanine-DL-glutamate epimerase-like enolase superfamily enzyme